MNENLTQLAGELLRLQCVTGTQLPVLFDEPEVANQEILGYSAIRAGLSSLPLGLLLMSAAGAAGPLLERIGTKAVLISGLGLFTVGLAWLAQIPLHRSYVSDILLPSLPIGAGLGLIFVAITVSRMWRWLRSGYNGGHNGLRDDQGEPR